MKTLVKYLLAILLIVLSAFTCSKKDESPVEPATTGSISGIVIEQGTNKQLENANVFTLPATNFVVTGSYGNYKISTVKPGDYTVYCAKTGFDTLKVKVSVIAGSNTTADFILTSSTQSNPLKYGKIAGIVRDSKTEQPLKNVLIKTDPVTFQISTNESGEFNLDNVLPGTYKVQASKQGYESIELNIVVRGGLTSQANVFMASSSVGTIRGKIIESSTGKPVEGANITSSPSLSSVSTDASGVFIIPRVSFGEYTLTASKAGYANSTVKISVKSDTTKADMVLISSFGTIEGYVKQEDGVTLPGVLIKTDPGTSLIISEDTGHYILKNIAPGKYKLLASKQGYTDFSTEVVVTAGNVTNGDIILKSASGSTLRKK